MNVNKELALRTCPYCNGTAKQAKNRNCTRCANSNTPGLISSSDNIFKVIDNNNHSRIK